MRLSRNFTLEELAATDTGLPNVPPPDARAALKELVDNVLQPARDAVGVPVRVTSGYRSPAVNRAVGGAADSQHRHGEAADIQCADNRALFEAIRSGLLFDQLIWEHGTDECPAWVHVSYRTQGNRKEVLRTVEQDGVTVYARM